MEIPESEKFFLEAFQNYQHDLIGSETEIVIMKRVAAYWYAIGRKSMLKETQTYHQRAIEQLGDVFTGGLPLWATLAKPYV